MSSGGSKKPTPPLDTGNVNGTDVSTNQQAVSIPLVFGTGKVSLRWISPALNQFTRPAPSERPGKK